MLSGQCEAGKVAFRKALEATKSGEIGPTAWTRSCRPRPGSGAAVRTMGDKDKFAAAGQTLTAGGFGHPDEASPSAKKRSTPGCGSALAWT
ncbi:MAG: hypothetical protein IPF92_17130 [Myxococcales bacterium]|nr:hypothetical protein [Myxococcales bacterium]